MPMVGMAVGVLGPFEALVDGVDVTPAARKERALLAMLAINHGRVIGADRLIEELWPDLTVDRARHVLQVRVAGLRKLLKESGAGCALQFVDPGYRLAVDPEDIDYHRFFALVDLARDQSQAGDPAGAAKSLREALSLWRGEPLADVQICVTLETEAARLAGARVDAIEDCVEAEMACGCHRAVVAELDGLVAVHPLRERLWSLRVLALYRCGRQAEALRACASIRRRLVDELGVEPGPALRALEAAVLDQRPELDWSPGAQLGASSPFSSSARGLHAGRDSIPPVQYVRTEDGVNLAYQVAGDGHLDLIVVPGFTSHLDVWWETWPRLARRLASFSRLILFDKRGMGLSDRPLHSGIEHWMEDTRVVLDAVGSEQAVILGMSAGGTVAILFAATYPERTRSLVLYGATARYLRDDDYPIGLRPERVDGIVEEVEAGWGSGVLFDEFCPSASANPVLREQYAWFQRVSASPGAAGAYLRALLQIDVRPALSMVSAPTLVLHATRDRTDPVERARYMAERITNAKMVELDSADHLIWLSDALDVMTNEIQDFVTGAVPDREINRVLTTVLLIGGVEPHDDGPARHVIDRFQGEVVKYDDNGILATFDGPARAIRCASAIVNNRCSVGGRARAGVHSGECEVVGDSVGGVAVRIARRVVDLARPGEVLVSQTVRDLVTGSAITFKSRGTYALEDVGRVWRVYAVAGS
jgi:pimeloyl-ACP methyl ester carboxylesterase/DNA-binding SARP family transcriptional activator